GRPVRGIDGRGSRGREGRRERPSDPAARIRIPGADRGSGGVRFTLRVESPVHVGNGETLGWLDWFVDRDIVHVLDWGAVVDAASVGREDVAEALASFTDKCDTLLHGV